MRLHRFPARPLTRRSRGNALIYVLLALVIMGLATAGYLSSKQLEFKTQAGQAEATVLDTLRHAVNNAISANMDAILAGQRFVGGGVTIDVGSTPLGEPSWEMSTDQLRQMGYLPAGWSATTSNLNGAPYLIRFRRTPATCSPALFDCDVEGIVAIGAPIREPDSTLTDGPLLGPILTKIGADSAVSLPATMTPGTGPEVLHGFGNTWTDGNPVTGNPEGVVAVRVGTRSSAWANFLRVRDARDPNFQGNLTMAGDLTVGGNTVHRGEVTVDNAQLSVNRADGTSCVRATPDGLLAVLCNGLIDARTGIFRDQVTTNTIQVNAGDFLVRNAARTLVRVNDLGDTQIAGSLTTTRAVVTPELWLNSPVQEGDPCTPNAIASISGGGLATCAPNGFYRSVVKFGAIGRPCAEIGAASVDANTGASLICRNGSWASINDLTSDFTLMATITVRHGSPVQMPSCKAATPSVPLIFVLPSNEISPLSRGFYRSAIVNQNSPRNVNQAGYYEGGEWLVILSDAYGTPLVDTNAIALTYCYYS